MRLVLLIITIVSMLTTSADAETAAELRARLSRSIESASAVKEIRDSLERLSGTSFAASQNDAVVEQILANPVAHVRTTRSRELAEAAVTARIDEAVDDLFTEVAKRRSTSNHRITVADLRRDIGEFDQLKTRARNQFIQKQFDSTFSAARATAAARQFQQKTSKKVLQPTYEKLNALLNQNSSFAAHRARLKQQTLMTFDSTGLLEENVPLLERHVDTMISNIERQVAQQQTFVDAVSTSLLSKCAVLTAEIEQELKDSLRKQLEPNSYPIFETVDKTLHDRAIELESEQFGEFVGKWSPAVPITTVEQELARGLANHRDAEQSLKLFVSQFEPTSRSDVVKAYLDRARSNGYSGDAETRLKELIRTQNGSSQLRRQLELALRPRVHDARQRLCDQQWDAMLADRLKSWQPSPQQVEAAFDQPEAISYQSATGLVANLPDQWQLLAETEQRTIVAITRIVETRVDRLRRQLKLVHAVATDQSHELPLDIAAGFSKSAILLKWENMVTDQWRAQIQGDPETLFDRTKREILKAVSVNYDSVQTKIVERRANAESTRRFSPVEHASDATAAGIAKSTDGNSGGMGSAGGASPGGSSQSDARPDGGQPAWVGNGPPPDGRLTLVNGSTGHCSARADFGQDSQFEFDPKTVERSAERLADHLIDAVCDLWKEVQHTIGDDPQKKRPLRLAVIIQSDEVRHRMTILLRHRIEAQCDFPIVWADSASK